MANSNFRTIRADYIEGISNNRSYITNSLGLQGTTGYTVYNDAFLLTLTDTVGEAVNVRNVSTGTTVRPFIGQPLFYTGTTPSGGLTLNTIYYVASTPSGAGTTASPWYFQISATPGGSAINLTSTAGDSNSRFLPYTPMGGIGTAITPSVTFGVSTASPLRGESSFLFTKDAVNRQGQGTSYAFTIDSTDQAKVMQIGFDYSVASGTFVTGDLSVYIVDATNGTVLQPSAYQIENVGVASVARLTFQTASNSTSYRLCFHVASVSALAYSLKFDNLSLGPQVVPMGAPVTDWVSYTPTGSWVTNTTYTGRWRRVGDQLHYRIRAALSGAPNAASLTIQHLPAGLSIDTSKLPTTNNGGGVFVGICGMRSAGTDFAGNVYNNGTNIAPIIMSASGTYTSITNVTNLVPQTFASGDYVEVEGWAPIVGWSSSTVVSSSADTRVVAARLTTPTAGSFSAATTVSFAATATVDTHGMFNGTDTLTCRVPGIYKVGTSMLTNAMTQGATGAFEIYYRVNGGSSVRIGWVSGNGTAGVNYYTSGSDIVRLAAGDTVQFRVTSSATATINSGAVFLEMLQGPSQIAASEVISMTARNNGVQAVTAGVTNVNYSVTLKDSHGAWNGSVYTCPAPGDYVVGLSLILDAANTPSILVNGASYARCSTAGASGVSMGYVVVTDCVAGTQISVRCNNSGNVPSDTLQKISIHRLGGVS